jgi:hypothetical protein
MKISTVLSNSLVAFVSPLSTSKETNSFNTVGAAFMRPPAIYCLAHQVSSTLIKQEYFVKLHRKSSVGVASAERTPIYRVSPGHDEV